MLLVVASSLFVKGGDTPPTYECFRRGDYQYCVYLNSLCWEHKGFIVLIDNASLDGAYYTFDNAMNDYPFHLPNIEKESANPSGAGPLRGFFHGVRFRHADKFNLSSESVAFFPDWSVLLRFDQISHNFFHWMTKINFAFLARYYEINGFARVPKFDGKSPPAAAANASATYKGYSQAFLWRRPATKWQEGYAALALGPTTRLVYESEINKMLKSTASLCFAAAVIPGADPALGDGLKTASVLREIAATEQGIRVPASQRNLITIFDQPGKRKILNLPVILETMRNMTAGTGYTVAVTQFSENTPYLEQAMHLAKTRILIATHGMVLLHSFFMESGGVVMELAPYQFNYPLYQRIVPQFSQFYMRYEAPLKDTKIQRFPLGSEAFYTNFTFSACAKERHYGCLIDRRDADIVLDVVAFTHLFRQALGLLA